MAARDDVDLKVLYWRTTTTHVFDLGSNTRHTSRVLKGCWLPFPFIGADKLCPAIIREIWANDYDVFVVSGLGPTGVLAMLLLVLFRRPWVLWAERPHPYRSSSLRVALRKVFYCIVGRMSCGVIAIGELALRAYKKLGIPENRLANVPYSPDVSVLLEPSENSALHAVEVRQSFGTDNDTIFLFCGVLHHRKGVDVLLRAFEECHRAVPNCCLVILGDGPERQMLESTIPEDIIGKVIFAGIVQRPRLFYYYLAADVFVFPSRYDGWGVVINEAMSAGLPVITTDEVGSAIDMVTEGKSGHIVPVGDVDRFAQRMAELAQSPNLRQCMGCEARTTAEAFTAKMGADKMVSALKTLTSPRVTK